MTNPDRNDYAGAWHPRMNRGARKRPTFLVDDDRRDFLDLLGQIRYRYGIETHAYALMTNHHHLVVRSTGGELAPAVRFMASKITRWFNRRHGFDGPQCRARFASVPITTDGQLATTVRYVHRNPYSLDPTISLAEHRWSSHAAYVGHTSGPAWLRQSTVLERFGDLRAQFRDFVEVAQPTDEFVLGVTSEVFEVPIADDSSYSEPSIGRFEEAALAASAAVDVDPRHRLHTRARQLAILIAVGDYGADPARCAAYFDSTTSAIRATLHRARRAARIDAGFAAQLEMARRIARSS